MKNEIKQASEFKKKQALIRYQRFLFLGKRVALAILLACLVWISVDGYHRLISRQMIEESAYLIKTLNPQLQVEVLEEIKNKEYFEMSRIEAYFSSLNSSPSGEINEEANQE
ncbi:MAG: hypothetical protein ABIB61_03845 [Candidatus Shapirobacteria bacterium]